MIAERIQQQQQPQLPQQQQQQQQQPQPSPQQPDNEFSTGGTKYYQFSAILEHVIDCLHTIVSDETNPYHPPLGWLTRRQPKPPNDELFLDLIDECSKKHSSAERAPCPADGSVQLSSSVRTRLERCPQQLRREITTRTQDGCSPLFLACRNGLIRVVKYLLDVCDADIEQKGLFEVLEDHHVHNVSPIWVAAVSGQLDVVRLLIDRGANVNSVSDSGSTPIRSVCFLCEDNDGAHDEHDNPCEDALPFGELGGHERDGDVYMKIVRLLLENGADISRPNNSGGTCLINSLHNHRLAAYLIHNGADPNAVDNQSKSALHYAILQDRLEVAKLLLEAGSDPHMITDSCDDALQLCCIGGHVNIFKHLIENYTYSPSRLSDAYKLLGSSILEAHYDLPQVRVYWTKSLEMLHESSSSAHEPAAKSATSTSQTSTSIAGATGPTETATTSTSTSITTATIESRMADSRLRRRQQQQQQQQQHSIVLVNARGKDDRGDKGRDICDTRRSLAYGDAVEFTSVGELHRLSMDDFRIQSLLISERVLGRTHRETIQRLLYRGTFYINSLRPNRCLDLWIYALRLRLETDSIHHFESIFAAQAITKFFLDLFSQRQHQQVKFNDVYDVLALLVGRIHECHQHRDIFDLLLGIIVNLLLVLRCSQRQEGEGALVCEITRSLIELNPRTSKGASMLHLCVAPNMFEGENHRSLLAASHARNSALGSRCPADAFDESNSPVIALIDNLCRAGLDVDSANNEGLSALQTICLATGMSAPVKRRIIRSLVSNGAHVDRRALSAEQDDRIRHALQESGVRQIDFVTLKCLAARRVSELAPHTKGNGMRLSRNLRELVRVH